MKKIRVSIVPYLNACPFLLGIRNSPVADQIELTEDEPAVGAQLLLNGKVDLALAPVAIIPELEQHYFVTDFGIACDGEVGSVGICSNVELMHVEKLFADQNSRTSNALARILLKEHWQLPAELIDGQPSAGDAQVVIGTRAFELKDQYAFFYDFGEAWKALTRLPFVFAAWLSTEPLPGAFVNEFASALANGTRSVDEVASKQADNTFDVRHYLEEQIQYDLDDEKRKGLNLFLEKLSR